MARKQQRVNVTLNREMRVALEVLSAKSNLGIATQAMVLLRQALDRTIQSEPVQIRVKQEQAFRTRDEYLADMQADTYVSNALTEGIEEDANG